MLCVQSVNQKVIKELTSLLITVFNYVDCFFIFQTAIIKNNPKKYLRSVGDGEAVEFDVVEGEKVS